MLFSARILVVSAVSLLLQAGFIQRSYAASFEFADTAAESFASTKIDGLLVPRVRVAARVALVSRQGQVCSIPGGRELLVSFFARASDELRVNGMLIALDDI
jgi:hypothetical protein